MKRKLLHFFSALKIKQKLSFLFLGILLIYLTSFFLVFSGVLRKQVYAYTLENSEKVASAIGKNLIAEIEKVDNYSRLLLVNKDIVDYLNGENMDTLGHNLEAIASIHELQSAFPESYPTYIFRNDKFYVSAGAGMMSVDLDCLFSKEQMKDIIEKSGGYVLRPNGNGAFLMGNQEDVISLMRTINDVNTLQKTGVLAVNFPISVLQNSYSEFHGKDRTYGYYTTDFRKLCGDITEDELSFIRNSESFSPESCSAGRIQCIRDGWTVYSCYNVPQTPFFLVSKDTVRIWDNVSIEIVRVIAFMILLTCLSLLGIGLFISVYITTPIQKLVNSMSGVKEGWLRRVSFKHCDDEIGVLKDSYNDMLVETNRLIEQLLDKEASIKKAEFDILQEQIKPHFLYNTIEMIACLSLDGKREEIYNALETLGSFYRKFLSKGDNEVSLRTEIDIIRDYLKLEKLRYGDIFDDVYEIDENCLDVKLPKLILQPLVENSLYHGVRLKGERGIIRIAVKKIQNSVIIEVYDNGIGMSSEQLSHVLENSKNFGLKRTVERFQYYAGDRGFYKIESVEEKFTCITFSIDMEHI